MNILRIKMSARRRKKDFGTCSTKGFTLFEALIMLAIVTAISSQVLFSFTGLNQGAALQRSAQELALGIRQAQNMSLAITRIEVGSLPTLLTPPAIGIRISSAAGESGEFLLFADRNDLAARDGRFSGPEERIGAIQNFVKGARIQRMVSGTQEAPVSVVHILFVAPEATLELTDNQGTQISDPLKIILAVPSGQTKTITARTSGQVSIQ